MGEHLLIPISPGKGISSFAAQLAVTWQALQVNRYTLMNSTTGEIEVKTLNKEQEQDTSHFKDAESTADLEVQEKTPLLEWLANTYKNYGCQLEFVTNRWRSALPAVQPCDLACVKCEQRRWRNEAYPAPACVCVEGARDGTPLNALGVSVRSETTTACQH